MVLEQSGMHCPKSQALPGLVLNTFDIFRRKTIILTDVEYVNSWK